MSVASIIATKGLRCNVERRTESTDAGGSVTLAWAVNIAGMQAFVQSASGAEALRYGRESNRKFVPVYVNAGQDIVASDRLTGVDLGPRILDIQNVRTPGELQAGQALRHMVLDCEETL